MKLVETAIFESSVKMRYADHADPLKATEWFEFRIPLDLLVDPIDHRKKFPEVNESFVAEVRAAALRYVRDVIGGETQGLLALISQNR